MRKINHNLVPDYLTKSLTSIWRIARTTLLILQDNRKITVFQNVD